MSKKNKKFKSKGSWIAFNDNFNDIESIWGALDQWEECLSGVNETDTDCIEEDTEEQYSFFSKPFEHFQQAPSILVLQNGRTSKKYVTKMIKEFIPEHYGPSEDIGYDKNKLLIDSVFQPMIYTLKTKYRLIPKLDKQIFRVMRYEDNINMDITDEMSRDEIIFKSCGNLLYHIDGILFLDETTTEDIFSFTRIYKIIKNSDLFKGKSIDIIYHQI